MLMKSKKRMNLTTEATEAEGFQTCQIQSNVPFYVLIKTTIYYLHDSEQGEMSRVKFKLVI